MYQMMDRLKSMGRTDLGQEEKGRFDIFFNSPFWWASILEKS